MEVMMRIPTASLGELRLAFDRESGQEDGLRLEKFISVMFKYLQFPKDESEEKKVDLVVQLIDLFNTVDVNGDGVLEWGEFTAYCIEVGMVATRRSIPPLIKEFKEDLTFPGRKKCCKIKWMKYFSDLNRVMYVLENSSKVKLASPENCQVVRELDIANIFLGNPFVISAEYVPELNLILVLSSNLSFSFWGAESLKQLGHCKTRSARPILCFASVNSILYSVSDNGQLLKWRLILKVIRDKYQCLCVPSGMSIGNHEDTITDIKEIKEHRLLATCSMDKTIILWDVDSDKKRTVLEKHERGVRFLAYSEANDLLLSAGYENEIYCWCMKSRYVVLRLTGLRATCIGLQISRLGMAGRQEFGIILESDSKLKTFDLSKTIDGVAACKQNMLTDPTQHNLPRKLGCFQSKHVALVNTKMRIFRPHSTRTESLAPSMVLHNHVLDCIVVVLGSFVQLWRSDTGHLEKSYFDLSESDISTACFDHRYRKLIIGNADGIIKVINIINGAVIKHGKVQSLPFCDFHYCMREKCLIVTSGTEIDVFDEDLCAETSEGVKLPLLRRARNVHSKDICASTFGSDFCAIVTAALDGSVRIWDFQELHLLAECYGNKDMVLGLQFVPKHNLLITGDDSGDVRVWEINRGLFQENIRCLDVIPLDDPRLGLPEWKPSQKGYGVRFLRVLDRFEDFGLSLVTVDYSGAFRVFNLTNYLDTMGLVPMKAAKIPWQKSNYNPRKMLEVDMSYHHDVTGASNTPQAKDEYGSPAESVQLELCKGWLLERREFSLITYSAAMELVLLACTTGISVVSSDGKEIGRVEKLMSPAEAKPSFWCLPNTRQAREEQTRTKAKELLRTITAKLQETNPRNPVVGQQAPSLLKEKAANGKYHKLVRSLSVPKVSISGHKFKELKRRLESPYRNYYHNYELETSHALRHESEQTASSGSEPSAFLSEHLGSLHKATQKLRQLCSNSPSKPSLHAHTPSSIGNAQMKSNRSNSQLHTIEEHTNEIRRKSGPRGYTSKELHRGAFLEPLPESTKKVLPSPKQELLSVLDAIIDDNFESNMYKRDLRGQKRAGRGISKRSKPVKAEAAKKTSRIAMIKQHEYKWRESKKLHVTNSHIGKFSKRTILLLKMDFDKLDVSKRGAITLEDLVNNMDSLTSDPPSLAAMNDIIDDDHNGEITFQELLAMFLQGATTAEMDEMCRFATMKPSIAKPPARRRQMTPEMQRDVKHLFSVYDKDNSGTITLEEILSGINSMPNTTESLGSVKVVALNDLKVFCSHAPKAEMNLDEFTEFMRDMFHPHNDDI